ncbi:MFS-type transporter SLC18B1-like [Tropilaelaps mercedesae]|uniref:MFS-type transporter SLC18B1-like n=1 Tax=Tropilaelaps mercedesae TaxID=418985 RepID=A0A1V9XPZ8_9ACAR|nr:MFS-type transporter SLC18B1-like [Tropilaelaps mercedesae]
MKGYRPPSSVTLGLLCLGLLLQGASDAHMASFLSEHAPLVGMSTSQYGIIMGANSIVAITMLPVIAKLTMLNLISDKAFLILGYLVDATAMLSMASVDYLGLRGPIFFFTLLALRVVQSLGSTIGFNLVYSVSGSELPDHSHITVPFLECMYGVGMTMGPAISGALYDVGGFPLPFIYHSGVLYSLVVFAYVFLPRSSTSPAEETSVSLCLLTRPTILVCMLMVATSNLVDTFNDSTFARLLSKFNLSTTAVGLSFFLPAGSYTVSSLVAGFVTHEPAARRVVLLVCALSAIGALLFIPPIVPLPRHPLWVVHVSEVVLGLSIGPFYVYSYLIICDDLDQITNAKTAHTATAAVTNWSSFFGCFVGPVLGNFITEASSLEDASVVITAITACTTVIYIIHTIIRSTQVEEKLQISPIGGIANGPART